MFRSREPNISLLEDLLERSSHPIPMNIRFHHPSFTHDHPADTLLSFLNATDLLQIRLVSRSTQEWADQRLPDIFSTLHYDVAVYPNRSLTTTPANITALQSIGQHCTHLTITISSTTPTSTSTSATTHHPQPPSSPPHPNPFPPLLSLTPSLTTLTISTPTPSPHWHALTLFPPHAPLVALRIALESAPSLSTFTTLRLWPISIMGIVSLRWHGLAAWGESGWMGARVWGRVRGLEIGLFGPWNCGGDSPIDSAEDRYGGGGGRGGDGREGTHGKMTRKVLHDYLSSFGSTLTTLEFAWLAPTSLAPRLHFRSFLNQYGQDHETTTTTPPPPPPPTHGPNPLTLHLNAPSSTGRKDFSAPAIRWRCLREVWLAGVQMSDGELGELVELGRAVVLERVFVRGGGLVRAEWEGCGRERGWERERVDDGDGYGGGWVVFEIGVERERGRRGGAAAAAAAADGDGYKDAGQTQLRVSGSTEDENGNYVDEEGSEVDDVLSEGSLEVPFILDW